MDVANRQLERDLALGLATGEQLRRASIRAGDRPTLAELFDHDEVLLRLSLARTVLEHERELGLPPRSSAPWAAWDVAAQDAGEELQLVRLLRPREELVVAALGGHAVVYRYRGRPLLLAGGADVVREVTDWRLGYALGRLVAARPR